MVSVISVKEKKLMGVKLGELSSWILMRDFTSQGIAGAFQRGYYWYYKYVKLLPLPQNTLVSTFFSAVCDFDRSGFVCCDVVLQKELASFQ
ncbi:ATP synthase subunit f, mitochondrial [Tupaia chinensis]|uniref:ATP synthase F(0) complex subunit f, mitochondrial n=1 Tax=Tupaia chinensis TaxID=246437 RepID=L9KV40_TUPCH|nr:ATP synthase subunit f, mitochondrial [Tupaia chinensis]